MSEKTIKNSIRRAVKTARTKRDEDGKRIDRYYGESRFRMPEYDRKNRNFFVALIVVGIVATVLLVAVLPLGSSFWWYSVLAAVVCWVAVAVWRVMDRKWSQDYEIVDEMISPGPTYKYSINAGTATDPFVDAERKLRKCLLHCSSEAVNDKHVKYECVEIDGSNIVFEFTVRNCYGFYDSIRKMTGQMAVEFGDPNGAEFSKIGDGKYRLVFDRGDTGANPMEAGVAYA